MYSSMEFSISSKRMYSSAEWERAESPGPIFIDGKCIKAWSLNVGEPNGFLPIATQRRTKGCSGSRRDDDSLKVDEK